MSEKKFVEKIKKQLCKDFTKKDRKGLYAKIQKMMAYNSNKIEGSTLTSEQTASLFDTGSIYALEDTIYRAKDIEEMNGHFKMFNYMLETIDEKLSEDIMKKYHYHLKVGVFEDMANGYLIGEYKNRLNQVSDIETALPKEVPSLMTELVANYINKENKTLEDILNFHADFEYIHPFQDGNGRVGRMILFRECLKNDIIPVIIKDETKVQYYHVLHETQINKNLQPFVEYVKKQQKIFTKEIGRYINDYEQSCIK